MKKVYLLMYYWADFEVHNDIIGVYDTRKLAEEDLKRYLDSHGIDEDDELSIDEVLLNRFIWEEGAEK